MFSMINRGKLDQATQQEFEHLFARLRGLLSQSFDQDGNLIVADPNLAVIPVGGIVPFAGATAPTGYLLCDGSQVSRVTYKSLFDVVGTSYGAGDGSTTFNVPDLRQRFPLGKAASGTGATLGATGGAIDHTHSGGSHTHSISSDGTHNHGAATSADGAHAHTVDSHSHTYSGTTSNDLAVVTYTAGTTQYATFSPHNHDYSGTTSAVSPATDTQGNHSHDIVNDGSHSHGGSTGSASGTTGTNNPPYAVVNYLVFAGI